MANMRIVYNNIADSATSVTASTTSGSLPASNLLTELKGQVHRSTGTSVTYTCTWSANQTVGAVILPCTNLTATATIRVRLYSDTAATTLVSDGGTVTAVPGYNLDSKIWPTSRDVNSFAYGGGVKAAQWFTSKPTNIRAVKIDLVDTSNPAGYIDCSRLVIGDYWSPTYNVQNGIQFDIIDNSEVSRRDSGDTIVNRSFMYDSLKFDFSLLTDVDKANLTKIIRNVGIHENFFVSLLPGDASVKTEHDSMIYGKRTNATIISPLYTFYQHSVEMIGW